MDAIRKLNVSIALEGKETEVGELAADAGRIYFRFNSRFMESGINISPFKLKVSNEIMEGPARPFEGLHGVFADSLPDGWGRLLLDRTLTSRGMLIEDITPLHRLSFVGNDGMGALQYRPAIEHPHEEEFKLELDLVSREMNRILEGHSSDVIEELYKLGGSSGGARPKILVSYNPKTDQLMRGIENLARGFEHWLIKFPAVTDRADAANIELAYHYMAKAAGIEMSKCRLFKGKSGRTYFGTRRFDRTSNGKLHMHSAAGLMHDDFRLSSLDYGHLMDCAFQLENSVTAHEKVLRLAAFNVFSHNRDDHSKNFSFLMDGNGNWQMAPAYDLTFSSSSHGFQSTSVAGESRQPGTESLLKLAAIFKMKKARMVIDEVKEAISGWKKFAQKTGIRKDSATLIGKRLESQLKL